MRLIVVGLDALLWKKDDEIDLKLSKTALLSGKLLSQSTIKKHDTTIS